MEIADTEPRQIPPTHPGEMLREDFVPDYDLIGCWVGVGSRCLAPDDP